MGGFDKGSVGGFSRASERVSLGSKGSVPLRASDSVNDRLQSNSFEKDDAVEQRDDVGELKKSSNDSKGRKNGMLASSHQESDFLRDT